MRSCAALLLAAAPFALCAFQPYVELSVSPEEVVLTESAEATIRIFMPKPFQWNPSIHANFIPEGSRLTMERAQISLDGGNAWRYTVKVPAKQDAAGVHTLGPVTVSIPTSVGFFGSRKFDIHSSAVALKVIAPPGEGRPKSYCGAISREFAATASLDTNVCTAGDPLLFTLDLSGATDPSMVHAPPVSEVFRDSPFKIDVASLKTETLAASKRFVWRVRTVKAGTVEFPSIDVSFFDAKSRTYRTIRTEPIPIQVRAGEQAALGALDEAGGETDEFPHPDGLDLPFKPESFTLKHALSLAFRAEKETDFAAAASRYAEFIDSLDDGKAGAADGLQFAAAHYANLGALCLMAGKPRDALKAYGNAELISGATAGTERGVRAAIARIRNDPRAELPLPRMMFPFWYRFALKGRIVFSACVLLALALLFVVALRAGRKLSVLAFAIGAAAAVQAWPFGGRDPFAGFFDDMPSMRRMNMGGDVCPIRAKSWFGSTVTMVGEPIDLVVMVEPGSVRIEPGSVKVEADIPGERTVGDLRSDSPNVYKMRVTFLEPGTNEVGITVSGVYSGTYCVTNGNMISSGRVMNQPFKIGLKPARVTVKPLPSHARPEDFRGAVGRSFRMRQTLSQDKVHPGDLVTAEYRLDFDGYCPSNAELRVEKLSREFKSYEVKEVARDAKSVTWRQILVPRTTEATNTALVSLSFYNLRTKRYERACAAPLKLTFVSAQAASTENTHVMVNDSGAGASAGTDGAAPASIVLRFAPSAKSPVVVTLPPGAEIRETGRYNGWRRLESSRGAGWVK